MSRVKIDTNELKERLRTNLCMMMIKKKINNRMLALKIGISPMYVGSIKNGNVLPSLEVVALLCWALECDVKDMFNCIDK
jgi:DNA-binding Xre family transcriptional regulator